MSKLTWGVNGLGECAVFCLDCRYVFKRHLKPYEAKEAVENIVHNCNQTQGAAQQENKDD